MIVEHKVFIGLRDVTANCKLKNTALLSYLEDVGGIHSNIAGFGLNDIPTTGKSWILLNWEIEMYERPKYADTITVSTWSRKIDKLYAYRDFEIKNEEGKIIGIATSKWILYDINNSKIAKMSDEIRKAYTEENKQVFDKETLLKLKIPEKFENCVEFIVNKNLIDINNHLHNIYYVDIANEVIPNEVLKNNELNNVKIMYKKEIKYGETVKAFYTFQDGTHVVVIKSQDENEVHAILELG